MTEKLSVEARSAALLVMDYQIAIVDGFAADKEALLNRMSGLIAAARAAQMMVLYVVVGFREGYPEISARNLSFSAVKSSGRLSTGSSDAGIHSAVAPNPGEVIVTKHRVSAFAGTDLDMILRSNGIDTLVLAGIATSGVVLSTLRHAADADYRLVVARDCCSDRDEEAHRVLLDKVFPRQSTVITAEEIVRVLRLALKKS